MIETSKLPDINWLDVSFPLRGEEIALDHGYFLLAAVSHLFPRIRQEPAWAIHPVYGQRQGPGVLKISSKSYLKMRVPQTAAGDLIALAGKPLRVGKHELRTGFPRMFPLEPRAVIQSRFVTIRGAHETPSDFERHLLPQLKAVLGNERFSCAEIQIGPRRIMKIRDKKVVGFALAIGGLDATGSLALQIAGLGGRRHMGAGIFIPLRHR